MGAADHDQGDILSLALLLYLAAWAAYWISRYGLTHPMGWYDAVWVVVIGLHSLQLSDLLTPVSTHAFLVLLAVFSVLNVTFLLLQPGEDEETALEAPPQGHTVDEEKLSRVWKINILLFVGEVAYFRGVPLVWLFSGDERTYVDFGIPSLHGAVMGLNLLLFTYYAALRPKGNGLRILVSVLLPILTVNRQVVISMFFQWIAAAALVQGSLGWVLKRAATVGAAVMAFFVGMGNLRTESSLFLASAQLTSSHPALLAVSWIYVYVAMAFQNVISIIDNIRSLYLGRISASTFAPSAFRILILGAERGPNYDAEVYQYIPSATFNVSGYLAEIYMDFGVAGVLVFNLVLGYLGALAYASWRRDRGNPRSILVLAIFAHGLILSFFFNMFLYMPILFQFAFAAWLIRPPPVPEPA